MSRWLILPEADGPSSPTVDYAAGATAWITAHGDARMDEVIVFGVDAGRREAIADHLSGWQVRSEDKAVVPAEIPTGRVTCLVGRDGQVMSDVLVARRFMPGGDTVAVEAPAQSLSAILCASEGVGGIVIDGRYRSLPALMGITWQDVAAERIVIVVEDGDPTEVRGLHDAITAGGYVFAGRPWGEAGAVLEFQRPRSAFESIGAMSGAMRYRAGQAWVRLRESRRRAAMAPIERWQVESAVDAITAGAGSGPWVLPPIEEDDPADLAAECVDRHGVYPISFSHPDPRPLPTGARELLSPILPGFPYAFDDEDEYLRVYGAAHLAITHRKAGWDCFRHVEILAAGSAPVMLDVDAIPRFSMVHYPKRVMRAVRDQALAGNGTPDQTVHERLRALMLERLTSRASAEYLLRTAGLLDAERILFVDANLRTNPEYQSTLVFLGLKQLRGASVSSLVPAPFAYRGETEGTGGFYGRGFGYVGRLDPDLKSSAERSGNDIALDTDLATRFDAVVIGSVSRNEEQTRAVLRHMPADRVILIHGEDGPPNANEMSFLRGTAASVFVRAIHD